MKIVISNPYTYFLISFILLFVTIIILQVYIFFKNKKSSLPSLSNYNEKILRELSTNRRKWFSNNEINKKLKHKDKIKDSLDWLITKDYISSNRRGLFRITNKGVEKLFEIFKEEKSYAYKSQEFLTNILIAFVVIMLAYSSFQLQSVQTSLMAQSNIPLQATLEFIPDKNDLVIPAFQLSQSIDINSPDTGWAKIDLTILNFGRMDSNHVYCFQKQQGNKLFGYLKPTDNFQNIPAGSSNRSVLHVKYDECYNTNENFCDKPDLVPKGNQNITLECECYGCKDQRKFEIVIPLCIYNQNESTCNEFKANLK